MMFLPLLHVAFAGCPFVLAEDTDSEVLESTGSPTTGSGQLRLLVVDDNEVPQSVDVEARGPDGAVRQTRTTAFGEALISDLPEGAYTVRVHGVRDVTLGEVEVKEDRTTRRRVTVRAMPTLLGLDPGPPAMEGLWFRYSRTACSDEEQDCPAFEVTVHRDGRVTFRGLESTRLEQASHVLTEKRVEKLREEVSCAGTLPSFRALETPDEVWTRLEVWDEERRWSWIWYGGDPRAPEKKLERVRTKLERAMGLKPYL